MNFFKLLGVGYKNYWKGLQFIFKHKLYWFLLFPIVLFYGIFEFGKYFERLQGSIGYDLKHHIADISSLNGVTWMTLKMVFFQQMYYLFTKFTLYFVIIFLSPVLAVVSEKTETILTGNKYPWNPSQLYKDIKRAIRLNIRLILVEYSIILLVITIGMFLDGTSNFILVYVIPVIIGFYFYGFGFIDYVNERRRLNIPQSIHFVSKHKGLAFAIGSVYSICFLSFHLSFRQFSSVGSDTSTQLFWGTILIIAFIFASVATLVAVTAATLSMHEIVDLSKNEYAKKTNAHADEKVIKNAAEREIEDNSNENNSSSDEANLVE